MNTKRLRELCDAVEAGSAKLEDIAELVVLAKDAAKALDRSLDACTYAHRSARCDGEAYCSIHNTSGRLD